jgi:hypothetical protein
MDGARRTRTRTKEEGGRRSETTAVPRQKQKPREEGCEVVMMAALGLGWAPYLFMSETAGSKCLEIMPRGSTISTSQASTIYTCYASAKALAN